MEEGERMPKPLFSTVLIKNPVTKEMVKEMDEKFERLPEAQRKDHIEKELAKMWSEVDILLAGPDCRAIKAGDLAIAPYTVIQSAMPICEGKYLIIPERSFIAVWS